MSKTIKISDENYRTLVELSGEMQKEIGRPVSIDRAIKLISKGRLSELAGGLKMSDDEVEEMFNTLSKGWKKWKISV